MNDQVLTAHPDEHVVEKVAGVAELATDCRVLEERIRNVQALDGSLSVFDRLANPHDWPRQRRREIGGGARASKRLAPQLAQRKSCSEDDLRLRERPRALLRAVRRATVSFE